MQLREYQIEGAAFLRVRSAALLADEMGLGKTVQAAVALKALFATREVRRALVVSPSGLVTNWISELSDWAPDLAARQVQGGATDRRAWYALPVPVLVASYEMIRADFLANPPAAKFGVLVLDEAQRLKNPTADVSVASARITAARRWALSATPLENSVDDLSSIMAQIENKEPRALDTEALESQIEGKILRRRKRDVLAELPPVVRTTFHPPLLREQEHAYQDVLPAPQSLEARSTAGLFAVLTKLKQLCNYEPSSNSSAKLDLLQDIVDAVESEKGHLLIFSQYVQTLRWLSARLRLPSHIYHGGLGQSERDALVHTFQTVAGPQVLLVSLGAGGVGLNLQRTTHLVLFDRWWNPAVEEQAVGRADRFGRDCPLLVYNFITPNTVEERIAALLERKTALAAEYVDGRPVGTAPSREELLRILGLTKTSSGPAEDS